MKTQYLIFNDDPNQLEPLLSARYDEPTIRPEFVQSLLKARYPEKTVVPSGESGGKLILVYLTDNPAGRGLPSQIQTWRVR